MKDGQASKPNASAAATANITLVTAALQIGSPIRAMRKSANGKKDAKIAVYSSVARGKNSGRPRLAFLSKPSAKPDEPRSEEPIVSEQGIQQHRKRALLRRSTARASRNNGIDRRKIDGQCGPRSTLRKAVKIRHQSEQVR